MGIIRRGGLLFVTWIGDHDPPHVHVIEDGKTLLVWDLKRDRAMKGVASRRILHLLEELRREGRI